MPEACFQHDERELRLPSTLVSSARLERCGAALRDAWVGRPDVHTVDGRAGGTQIKSGRTASHRWRSASRRRRVMPGSPSATIAAVKRASDRRRTRKERRKKAGGGAAADALTACPGRAAYLPPGDAFGFSFFGLRFSFCALWPFDMIAVSMLHNPAEISAGCPRFPATT